MSTQHGGGNRRPSTVKPGGKPTTGIPATDTTDDALEYDDTTGTIDVEVDEATTAVADDVDEPDTVPAPASDRAAGTKAAAAKAGTVRKAGTTRSGTARAGTTRTGGRPAAGRNGTRAAAAGRPGAAKTTARPAAKGGGRKPIAPVRVSQGRNWGPIALFTAVALLAVAIIGYAAWQVRQNSRTFEERASDIAGVVNFRKIDPSLRQQGQHAWGPLQYPQSPPVGGKHNFNWQNCMGDVYDAPIASEHAVHSLEHGAVWVTYNPDKLSKDQVALLAKRVRGKEYMLMSPYPGLDKPISLQAWGYQLKLDSATDGRIDEFIKVMRKTAGIEQNAVCSGGITEPGTTPRDLGKDQQQQPGG
jgi:hypothetical protein